MTLNFESFSYETDEEYRNCIFDIFQVPENKRGLLFDGDDNNVFDQDEVLENILLIYEKTDGIPWFRDLYFTTANTLFTDDRHIGIILLFSYDWLRWWIPCLAAYWSSPETWTPDNECAKTLLSKHIQPVVNTRSETPVPFEYL